MRKKIIEKLNRAIANKELSISQMSEQLEIDRTVLNKFVNGQRIPNIEVIMKVLDFLFPKEMDRYLILRDLVPSFKTIYPLKVILDIARLNRDEATVTKAAEIIKHTSKQKDREWADYYLLWQNYRAGKMDKAQYLESLLSASIHSKELKAFKYLSLCFYHYSISSQPEIALEYCEKAKQIIDELPPSLLRNSYLARYYNYYGQILMRANNLEDTIFYLEKSNQYVISYLLKGFNLYNIGVIYQYTNHKKSIDLIMKGQSIMRDLSCFDPSLQALADYLLKETIPLNKIIANDFADIKEEDLLYPQSKIMYNIKINNLEKARYLLNELTEEEKEDEYFLLCAGMIEKSIPLLMKSLSKFIEKYLINEAELPIRELIKLGCDKTIIDSMINARLGNNKVFVN
ncbi:AimR family lysis-lysogeny pheromone receptor [Neobacillus sp. D3-1R]|uniref:AimR family lysis-lysogeny pheromone receptor n=1 Tax=Neobacillus sp. D3-1R TaxID=3445778 RepID=UPI003FA0F6D4